MSSQPSISLPSLPAEHADWIQYMSARPDTPMTDLVAPYKEYESKLREIYAQDPSHPAIGKQHVVPVFTGHEKHVKIRARDLAAESQMEADRYIMPLQAKDRRKNNEPAIVQSLKEFQTNFQLFSESSLVDLDWSNIVVAGSAATTALLPVPDHHNASKRALRHFYHEKLAPASDVDIFLYALTEEEAIEKIKQIEQRVRDSILTETTSIRTKHAITIASQYPTRHIQIVLRIYRSISEILTGFDVDSSCVGYDGKQVYASPRALAAFVTQINTIDLTRRSPSYENRLSKYARRGFEIYWPLLDRSRIDPTLFERSFGRTLGLARLLVLEKLPGNKDREAYVDQRRAERGRPSINRWSARKLPGNMKEDHDDEVAEWVETDEVADYHTFTVPYGPRYHARKIERLLYAKDLLLNAEWNRPKDRETELHRHPSFFGDVVHVIGDCCGHCPEPVTPEDKEIWETESKTYVSGNLEFIKDNPGRQSIGSFNPLNDDDWTEMAYVGNTSRLCQAIVECDLETVEDWVRQEEADPNRRDYTGRAPLHLAAMCSTPEIVQCLIDAGARITARVFDGKTALHIAAMRGNAPIVKALLVKSNANQDKADKEAIARKAAHSGDDEMVDVEQGKTEKTSKTDSSDDDIDMLDDQTDNVGAETTEDSVIRIDRKPADEHENLPEDDNDDEPDIYDINVLAWDVPVSALHLAIANGHTEVVKLLVSDFGADLAPVKRINEYNKSARTAILPLVLALHLPLGQAQEMTDALISLGASPSQADIENITALHYFAAHGAELLSQMCQSNRPAAQRAVNHIAIPKEYYSSNPLKNALRSVIECRDLAGVKLLLELGAKPQVDFAAYVASRKANGDTLSDSTDDNKKKFRQEIQQPVITAVYCDVPPVVSMLLDAGADVNELDQTTWSQLDDGYSNADGPPLSLLDLVRDRANTARKWLRHSTDEVKTLSLPYGMKSAPIPLEDDAHYLAPYDPSSYAHWAVSKQLREAKKSYDDDLSSWNEYEASGQVPKGAMEKSSAVKTLLAELEVLEADIIARGGKTFKELYPDHKLEEENQRDHSRKSTPSNPWEPKITFHLPDLTDERKAGYLRLFEACWHGDLTTIKSLTLAIWDENESPLAIAVRDYDHLSPFSIAVMRNHFDVARAILEIAHAQYAPEETAAKPKHSLVSMDEEDEELDSDDIQIYSEIVDDKFTIDEIGHVQNKVKSKVTPLEMLSWPCPVSYFVGSAFEDTKTRGYQRFTAYGSQGRQQGRKSTGGKAPRKILKNAANNRFENIVSQPVHEYISADVKPGNLFQLAIFLDDPELLHFLIAMGEDHTTHSADTKADETAPKYFHFAEDDFLYAIRLGKVQILQVIISRTGAGIPFNDLVKNSGIEMPKKLEYYEGLTVNGKKRKDWANAGRDTQCKSNQELHPPLLHAAQSGSTESVDWFLSDAAQRCYNEFANNNRDDIRIQNLGKTTGGLETSMAKWLNLRSHLLLHCVVLGKTTETSLQLLRHVCENYPDSISHRSSSGLTPLHLAFSLRRTEMVRALIEAGADQTCRDNVGNNICHSLLEKMNLRYSKSRVADLEELLGTIDSRLIVGLFKERTTALPGAATPLAKWMYESIKPSMYSSFDRRKPQEKFVEVILKFSQGEDLDAVNSEGDTPIHAAVRYAAAAELRVMLDCRPELLFRENATGRTPYEMAQEAYFSSEVFSDPPPLLDEPRHSSVRINSFRSKEGRYKGILDRPKKTFVEDNTDHRPDTEQVWELCKEFAEKTSEHKRKLVSLVEASEVAKRLAALKKQTARDDEAETETADKDKKHDEVEVWYRMALGADE